ncbi:MULTISPECIES: bacteriocin immunity protein [Pseudomonas]|uniref:bacteriocin immunity protein n=1 Tax=Pseudomonas sp. 273 TaxID=75692 RepID=UPI0023D84EF9|nr:bacteriocin immunity protein [Pseudomonas sp. 273]
MKNTLSDYTEQEFTDMLRQLCSGDMPEKEEDRLLSHFIKISGHPAGSDLLYYPESGVDDSPEGITRTVKEWRAANGLPGFKSN